MKDVWIEDGILLEKAVSRAESILEIPHSHNRFDDKYVHGYGVDNVISTSRGNIEGECKNLNGNHMLSPRWIIDEVLSRYSSNPFLKVLIISLLNCSRRTKRLLDFKHVHIIELGYKVTKWNYRRAVHDLVKKLYWIKLKYSNILGKKLQTFETKLSEYDSRLKAVYNVVIDVGFCKFVSGLCGSTDDLSCELGCSLPVIPRTRIRLVNYKHRDTSTSTS